MKQSPSWEASSVLANEEIPAFNATQNLVPYSEDPTTYPYPKLELSIPRLFPLLEDVFKYYLPTCASFLWMISSFFLLSDRNSVCFSPPFVPHDPPICIPLFDHPNNIWLGMNSKDSLERNHLVSEEDKPRKAQSSPVLCLKLVVIWRKTSRYTEIDFPCSIMQTALQYWTPQYVVGESGVDFMVQQLARNHWAVKDEHTVLEIALFIFQFYSQLIVLNYCTASCAVSYSLF